MSWLFWLAAVPGLLIKVQQIVWAIVAFQQMQGSNLESFVFPGKSCLS
jgi:hypothetical protein